MPNGTDLPLLSPEARVSAGAFRAVRRDLAATLRECGSGRELRAQGYADDVTHAAQWNAFGSCRISMQVDFFLKSHPLTAERSVS